MPLVLNTNLYSLTAQVSLAETGDLLTKSVEKLSSGLRIYRAADDTAGLSISEKMRSQLRGLNQAVRNNQDAISAMQTADGGLATIHAILQRMRELAVQGSNDTLVSADRLAIIAEMNSLQTEIDNIANRTRFNNQVLLNGAFSSKTMQVGENQGDTTTITLASNTSTKLGVDTSTLVETDGSTFRTFITTVTDAITTVAANRSTVGAAQNQLESNMEMLRVASVNTAAAESRIRDADMALEMSKYARNNIMLQAGTALLAQANAQPNLVLTLFAAR